MKRYTPVFMSTFLICLLTLATGCAKKELLKADEATTQGSATTEKPSAMDSSVDEEVQKEAVIMEKPAPANADASLEETELETIYFDFDSYILSPEARERLFRTSRWLRENPSVTVLVEGHTDEQGSDSYNIVLGERRAKSALQYLLTMGIDPQRLSVISYGEEKPAATGHEEDAWSKNRRAEFVITR